MARSPDGFTIGVAITTYRRPEQLARCLAAVASLGDLVRAVCVVDDDPNARPTPRPSDLAPGVDFIALVEPENAGLPAALTRAFDALATTAEVDGVLVLDDDTEVDAGLVEALAAALEPGVGAATVPTPYCRRYSRERDPALFAWSPTLLRRAAIEAVGSPDAALFFGYDDWDYAWRLREAGWRIAWVDRPVPRRSALTYWPERRYFALRNALWLSLHRRPPRAVFVRVLLADIAEISRALVVGASPEPSRGANAGSLGLLHGLRGRLGPPPAWVLAGRAPPPAAQHAHGGPAPSTSRPAPRRVERVARRLIGVARVELARAVGRAGDRVTDPGVGRVRAPRPATATATATASSAAPSPQRVLAHLDTFPPFTNAGSELAILETLAFLAARGHSVRVLVHPPELNRVVDGRGDTTALAHLDIRPADDRSAVRDAYLWSTVVCTQLGAYNRAARWAARHRRPVVAFLRHSSFDPRSMYAPPDLLVYCATWIATRQPWPGPSIVLHPPVDGDHYRTARGDRITMINLSAWKGGALLEPLARRLPGHAFLGVLGAWGEQVVPTADVANLMVRRNTPDARAVYAQTRVLLHPSIDEAYPRVVLEAAVSGIPTIAHPAEGTRAALGDAAIYVERDDVDGWTAAIERLDDPAEYARWSERARDRFDEHDPTRELLAFEAAVIATARRGPR